MKLLEVNPAIMKKGQTLPKAREVDILVNDCKCERKTPEAAYKPLVLQRFLGFVEGSTKPDGTKLYFARCEYCKEVFYKIEEAEFEGDMRLVQVNS